MVKIQEAEKKIWKPSRCLKLCPGCLLS